MSNLPGDGRVLKLVLKLYCLPAPNPKWYALMPRLQFTIRALLVATLVAAAFFGGAAWQRRRGERELQRREAMLIELLTPPPISNAPRPDEANETSAD